MRFSAKFLACLMGVWGCAAFVAGSALAAADQKPNLVLIVTDDQGYHDVGFNGCEDIPTPHMDSIAVNGVRFTSGYVSYTVCSPSRAGLLTGRYQQRFGHERNPRFQPQNPLSGLPRSEATLADVLGRAGYRSALIGKWHLGAHPELHPLKRGFTEFYGFLGGGHRYFPEDLTFKEPIPNMDEAGSYKLWLLRNHEPVQTTNYLTDELSDEAVRFIARNKAEPFFLYLAYNAPHSPLQAPEKYLARFSNIPNQKRRTYAAMVSAVDDGVGRVLAELRRQGIEQNTLVAYLSDNGGPGLNVNGSVNTPLRGTKGSPYEGGFRVPFAVQWPGQLPKGLVYDRPVLSLDIFATMAALAKAPLDSARPLDGVNLLPYLKLEKKGDPHEAIYLRMHDRGSFTVRKGDYKLLIERSDAEPELYDVHHDISEEKNLARERPEVVAELERLRAAWARQLVPPVFEGLLQKPGQAGAGKQK